MSRAGVGAAPFGEKIVVAAQAGELQFEVVEQKQGSDAEVRVQHLRIDAVEIHVLEPRDRIPGALADGFVGLARLLVVFELLAALDFHPHGAAAHAVNHPGVAVRGALNSGRAVAQFGGDAFGPGIAGFLHVIVGRNYIVLSPSLLSSQSDCLTFSD